MIDSFATLWTVALQAPLSMGFSRQEYWSALPLLPPGDLPDPGIEPTSPALVGGFFTAEPLGKSRYKDVQPLKLSINQTELVSSQRCCPFCPPGLMASLSL